MKIYFTYGTETKEGFEVRLPTNLADIPDESVEEIQGMMVLEKVPNLVKFIEECYRILQFDKMATFTSNHFTSGNAWVSPFTIRGVGEYSLHFSNKVWREANKFTEAIVMADFDVVGNFAIDAAFAQRADDAKSFAMKYYNNIVQLLVINLTKKRRDG